MEQNERNRKSSKKITEKLRYLCEVEDKCEGKHNEALERIYYHYSLSFARESKDKEK